MAAGGFPSTALRDDWSEYQADQLDEYTKDLPPVAAKANADQFDAFTKGLGTVGDALGRIRDQASSALGGFTAPPVGADPATPAPPTFGAAPPMPAVAPPLFGADTSGPVATGAAPPPQMGMTANDPTMPAMPTAAPPRDIADVSGVFPPPPRTPEPVDASATPDSGTFGPNEMPVDDSAPMGPPPATGEGLRSAQRATNQREAGELLGTAWDASNLPFTLPGAISRSVLATKPEPGQDEWTKIPGALWQAVTGLAAGTAAHYGEAPNQSSHNFDQFSALVHAINAASGDISQPFYEDQARKTAQELAAGVDPNLVGAKRALEAVLADPALLYLAAKRPDRLIGLFSLGAGAGAAVNTAEDVFARKPPTDEERAANVQTGAGLGAFASIFGGHGTEHAGEPGQYRPPPIETGVDESGNITFPGRTRANAARANRATPALPTEGSAGATEPMDPIRHIELPNMRGANPPGEEPGRPPALMAADTGGDRGGPHPAESTGEASAPLAVRPHDPTAPVPAINPADYVPAAGATRGEAGGQPWWSNGRMVVAGDPPAEITDAPGFKWKPTSYAINLSAVVQGAERTAQPATPALETDKAIVLVGDHGDALIDRRDYDYFRTQYPDATFATSPTRSRDFSEESVLVRSEGKAVGVIWPSVDNSAGVAQIKAAVDEWRAGGTPAERAPLGVGDTFTWHPAWAEPGQDFDYTLTSLGPHGIRADYRPAGQPGAQAVSHGWPTAAAFEKETGQTLAPSEQQVPTGRRVTPQAAPLSGIGPLGLRPTAEQPAVAAEGTQQAQAPTAPASGPPAEEPTGGAQPATPGRSYTVRELRDLVGMSGEQATDLLSFINKNGPSDIATRVYGNDIWLWLRGIGGQPSPSAPGGRPLDPAWVDTLRQEVERIAPGAWARREVLPDVQSQAGEEPSGATTDVRAAEPRQPGVDHPAPLAAEPPGAVARDTGDRAPPAGRGSGEPDVPVRDEHAALGPAARGGVVGGDAGRGPELAPAPEASDGTPPETQADRALGVHDAPEATAAVEQQMDDVPGSEAPSAQHAEPTARGRDYVITPADDLFAGGWRSKAAGNIAAIRLLKELEAAGRLATAAEQAVLVKYVGWGASSFAPLFKTYYRYETDPASVKAAAEQAEIKALMTPEEWDAANHSTLNAHYTSPEVIDGMWAAARRLGVADLPRVRMLEPSAGIGHFFGLQPADLAANSIRTAVELDKVSGALLKHLYQASDVYAGVGYQDAPIPAGHVDLIIGNFPFAKRGGMVAYPPFQKDNRLKTLNEAIHNFFIGKGVIRDLRPGGLMAAITTHHTMDAADPTIRRIIAEHADLLGAIRLPKATFGRSADTEVVTDILFLRKRFPGEAPRGEAWSGVAPASDKNGNPLYDARSRPMVVNEYFLAHPEMALGTHADQGSMRSAVEYTLLPHEGADLPTALAAAVERLPQNVIGPADDAEEALSPHMSVPATVSAKEYAYVEHAGGLYVRIGGKLVDAALGATDATRVRQMMGIRDVAREHYRLQQTDAGRAAIDAKRAELNAAYDKFVKAHGPLHGATNKGLMRRDPDGAFLLGLENWGDNLAAATTGKDAKITAPLLRELKTLAFSTDTMAPPRLAQHADNLKDAVAIVTNEFGRLNLRRMAELTGRPVMAVQRDLIAEGLAFQNPEGGLEQADVYLSGDVRAKLRAAETAAAVRPEFTKNVTALKAVQPKDKPPSRIAAPMGNPWVPAEVVNQFIAEAFKAEDHYERNRPPDLNGAWFRYVPDAATWVSTHEPSYIPRDVAVKWATPRRSGREITLWNIVTAALERRDRYEVTYTYDGKTYHDDVATDGATAKLHQIKDDWQRWLWSDVDRADRMARLFNDTHNALVRRDYDGSHLTLPGMSPLVTPYHHQKSAVWRFLQDGTGMAAHEAGFGKSLTAAALTMEAKRLGLARKTVIAEPKSLVVQMGAEFMKAYPNATLLMPEVRDFQADNRNELMSRIMSGDQDAVIISHEQLAKLPMRPENALRALREAMAAIDRVMAAHGMVPGAKRPSGNRDFTQKALEAMRADHATRILRQEQRLAEYRDNTVFFEDLGIDQLIVDEAHLFRRLAFPTMLERVKGLSPAGSDRAFDLKSKTDYILRQNGGRGVIFLTGTPVSNTLAELWTIMRYLMPDRLTELGIDSFDGFFSTFARITSDVEYDATGRYRVTSRLDSFTNLQQLSTLFQSVADVRMGSEMPEMRKTQPRVVGGERPGERTMVEIDPSQTFLDYQQELIQRAENMPNDPRIDNHLKLGNDSRKASLDMRLIDPSLPEDPNSKIAVASSNIAAFYHETADDRATQMVFMDLGVPKKPKAAPETPDKDPDETPAAAVPDTPEEAAAAASAYGWLKAKLVAKGVKANEIGFMQTAKTDAQRAALIGKVRTGEIRVLIGSTQTMGIGVNAQNRLGAIHFLTFPWTPDALEQAEKRIIRPGNHLFGPKFDADGKLVDEGRGVRIFAYLVRGSFDAAQANLLFKKAGFYKAALRRQVVDDEVGDIDEARLGLAEMRAIASGNPYASRYVQLESERRQLRNILASHEEGQWDARRQASALPGQIEGETGQLADVRRDAALAEKNKAFSLTIGKETATDRKDGWALLEKWLAGNKIFGKEGHHIGTFRGFNLGVRVVNFKFNFLDGKRVDASQVANIAFTLARPGARDGAPTHSSTYIALDEGKPNDGWLTRIENVLAALPKSVTDGEKYVQGLKDQLEAVTKRAAGESPIVGQLAMVDREHNIVGRLLRGEKVEPEEQEWLDKQEKRDKRAIGSENDRVGPSDAEAASAAVPPQDPERTPDGTIQDEAERLAGKMTDHQYRVLQGQMDALRSSGDASGAISVFVNPENGQAVLAWTNLVNVPRWHRKVKPDGSLLSAPKTSSDVANWVVVSEHLPEAEAAPETPAEVPAEGDGTVEPPEEPPTTDLMPEEEPEGEPEHKYEHGSTQIDLPPEIADRMQKWARANIREADLAADGYETEPHVTVQYGLTSPQMHEDVDLAMVTVPAPEITFGKTGVFAGPEYDVVYVTVNPEGGLTDARQAIRDQSTGIVDTHPTYTPHATLAYVKPGLGARYAGRDVLGDTSFTPETLTLSDRDGNKTAIDFSFSPAATKTNRPATAPQAPVASAEATPEPTPAVTEPVAPETAPGAGDGEPPAEPPATAEAALTPDESPAAAPNVDRLIGGVEQAGDQAALNQVENDILGVDLTPEERLRAVDAVVKRRQELGVGARSTPRKPRTRAPAGGTAAPPPPTPPPAPPPGSAGAGAGGGGAPPPPTPPTPPPAGSPPGPYNLPDDVRRLMEADARDADPFPARTERAWQNMKRWLYDRVNLYKAIEQKTGVPAYALARAVPGQRAYGEAIVEHKLKPMLKPVLRHLDLFQDYLNGMRMQDVRARNPDAALPNDVQDPARATRGVLDRAGPAVEAQITRVAARVWAFSDENILTPLVDAGMLSPERRQEALDNYPHYVPFMRQGYDLAAELAGGGPGDGSTQVASYRAQPIKRMLEQGSSRKLDEPIAHLAAAAVQVRVAIARNKSAVAVRDALRVLQDEEDRMAAAEGRLPEKLIEIGHFFEDANGALVPSLSLKEDNEHGLIWWRQDGGKLRFARVPLEVAMVARQADAPEIGMAGRMAMRLVRGLSSSFKAGATYLNPDFVVRQIVNDWTDMYMRGGPAPFSREYRQGWLAALTHNATYWEAAEHAAFMAASHQYRTLRDLGYAPGPRWVGATPVESPADLLLLPLRLAVLPFKKTVGAAAATIEEAGRIAAYLKKVKPRGPDTTAGLRAIPDMRDLLIDFNKAGTLGQFVGAVQPFWNVSVQFSANAYRTVRDDVKPPGGKARFPWRTLLRLALPVAMISTLVELWNRRFSTYDDLPDYAWSLYWPVIYGEIDAPDDPAHPGVSRKIPLWAPIPKKGFAAIFSAVPEMALKMGRGTDHTLEAEAWNAAHQFGQALLPAGVETSPIPIPPLAAAWLQIKDNRDWYRATNIVPDAERNLPPEDRYNTSATRPAILAGRALGVSPRDVDFAMTAGFGGLGRTLGFMGDMALAPLMDKNPPGTAYQRAETPEQFAGRAPITRVFTRAGGGGEQARGYDAFQQALAESERAFTADPDIRRLGISLGPVGTTILNGKLELTPGERAEYQRISGRIVQEHLPDLTGDDRFQNDAPDTQKRLVQALVAKAHKDAQKELVQDVIGEDEVIERVNARRMARAS